MNKWLKMTAFAVAAIVGMSLTLSVYAADDQKPEPKKHGPMVSGEIVSIAKDCIKVKGKDGQEVAVAITDATKFGSKNDPKTCDDFKVGDKVVVGYKEDGDKKVATRIGAPHKKNQ